MWSMRMDGRSPSGRRALCRIRFVCMRGRTCSSTEVLEFAYLGGTNGYYSIRICATVKSSTIYVYMSTHICPFAHKLRNNNAYYIIYSMSITRSTRSPSGARARSPSFWRRVITASLHSRSAPDTYSCIHSRSWSANA